MKIGILGLTFKSGNKGCQALSYAFMELLNRAAQQQGQTVEVVLLTPLPTQRWLRNRGSRQKTVREYAPERKYSNLRFGCLFYLYKGSRVFFLSRVQECSFVVDYTAGDSFTDLYGAERFWSRTRVKKAVEDAGVPLILGSQTIGPFRDEAARAFAAQVIRGASEVYVRDAMSLSYTEEISGRKAILTSDIAFALPFVRPAPRTSGRPRVGFNPSGLLWNGGYTGDNQFGLTVDYRTWCREVISGLLPEYEVHLIPHAFSQREGGADNDMVPVRALHEEFPETVMAQVGETPMEVKSCIAGMDVFIGARMHATIGAFSAGVPVIPFSYSRKFEGLFDSLSYPYVIHGCQEETGEAVRRTLESVKNRGTLLAAMAPGQAVIRESNERILSEMVREMRSAESAESGTAARKQGGGKPAAALKRLRSKWQKSQGQGRALREEQKLLSRLGAGEDDLSYRAMMFCHALEKGMGIRQVKEGYGREKAALLIKTLREMRAKGMDGTFAYQEGTAVLLAYFRFQEESGVDIRALRSSAEEAGLTESPVTNAGYRVLSRGEVETGTPEAFSALVSGRHSCRAMSAEPVTGEEMEAVITDAGRAPSACNRQPSKVYYSLEREKNAALSGLVPGNRGFADDIPYYCVVTASRRYFGSSESFQWYVNGGIFLGFLALSFHAHGLGSCIFQFPLHHENEEKLRALCGIPEEEAIVAIVGYGKYPETFKAICAQRRPVSELARTF